MFFAPQITKFLFTVIDMDLRKIFKDLRRKFALIFLPSFAYFYVRLLFMLCNIEVEADSDAEKLIRSRKPVILAFWHGRLLLMPYLVAYTYGRRGTAIVSRHGDGEYISRFLFKYRHTSIKGSTNKGGFSALKEAFRTLRVGKLLAITPDGPTGPRYKIQGNLAILASQTDTLIICACYSVKKAKVFQTWDRFMLPLPIPKQKILIRLATPIDVKKLMANNKNKDPNILLTDKLNAQMTKLEKDM